MHKNSCRQCPGVIDAEQAGLSRERFEEMLALLPDGMIDQIHLEADAERLIAAFGEEG